MFLHIAVLVTIEQALYTNALVLILVLLLFIAVLLDQ